MSAILSIKDFNLSLGKGDMETVVLDHVNFEIPAGSITALVGKSGSGKSQMALSILGLNQSIAGYKSSGDIIFSTDGEVMHLNKLSDEALRKLRNEEIAYVFQQSANVFNPSKKIGEQIVEALLYGSKISREEAMSRAAQAIEDCELIPADRFFNAYPHQLSGGQIQRALIAMALINDPSLIIADEPTSALDSHLKESVMSLFKRINQDRGTTILIISHDLNLVSKVSSNIVVIDNGQIVEVSTRDQLINNPQSKLAKDMLDSSGIFNAVNGNESGIQTSESVLIEVEDIHKNYASKTSIFSRNQKDIKAVDGVNLKLHKGEILGIVGPSGSGKSTLARLLALMEDFDSGNYSFDGQNVYQLSHREFKDLKSRIQMIFQDPLSALAPHLTVQDVLSEVAGKGPAAAAKINSALTKVELDTSYLSRVPRMLSGGERQRVLIARALLTEPSLLICDEILSALDVITQMKIVELLKKLNKEQELSIIFISHDRNVVNYISNEQLSL